MLDTIHGYKLCGKRDNDTIMGSHRWCRLCKSCYGKLITFVCAAYAMSYIGLVFLRADDLHTMRLISFYDTSLYNTTWTSETIATTTPPDELTDKPMKVVILTYQRSGSSFFGQIFNQNDDAFYAFEPLDGLYSAIYGTSEGFNSPSDIVQYWNGTRREIPDFEVRSSARVLDDLLTCNHDKLPTEMMMHIFWYGFSSYHRALANFTNCLRNKLFRMSTCKGSIRKSCRIWFGDPMANQTLCRDSLWLDTSSLPRNMTPPPFRRHRDCTASLKKKASHCFPYLTNVCGNVSVRSAKVVRLNMAAAGLLLNADPDTTRVIHLLRDPKAVALSRMKYESVRSHDAKLNKVREAHIVCRTMYEDLVIRKKLEEKFPNRIQQVIYENFISDPVAYTRDVYRFIQKVPPGSVLDYFRNQTSLNGTNTLSGLSEREISAIDGGCHDVYELLNHSWGL